MFSYSNTGTLQKYATVLLVYMGFFLSTIMVFMCVDGVNCVLKVIETSLDT